MSKRVIFWGIVTVVALTCALNSAVPVATAEHGGSISGRVINDLDGDGNPEDAGEPGLAGWRVVLQRETEQGQSEPLETRTDRSGEYHFDALVAGDYTISIPCERQPDFWVATWPNYWADTTTSVEEGEDSGPNEFLLRVLDQPPQPTGSIAGRLIWDENKNAQPDPSERGAAGWNVEIAMPNAPKCFPVEDKHATTSADGTFKVSDLIAGSYLISMAYPLDNPNTKFVLDYPGSSQDFGGDGEKSFYFEAPVEVPEGGTGSVTVGVLDVTGTGSISGEIYWDQNEDGIRSANEPLVDCDYFAGIMVRTPNGFAPIYRAIATKTSGGYSFTDLAGGKYRVLFLPQALPAMAGETGVGIATLPQDGHVTGVDFGLWSLPGESLPTVEPSPTETMQPPVTPSPVATTTASVIGGPNTGTGGDSDPVATPWLAATLGAGGLALIAGGALRLRRAKRRKIE